VKHWRIWARGQKQGSCHRLSVKTEAILWPITRPLPGSASSIAQKSVAAVANKLGCRSRAHRNQAAAQGFNALF